MNIFPRKSQVSLATSPPGLGLAVDGVPVSTPRTFTGVEGFQRELSAPSNAVAQDGTPLQFAGWSDGKSIRHVITTPEDDTTYTATYQPSQPFTAKYYDNTTFSGAPVLTRQDPNINFVWGEGSPDPALPVDGFSVRWTKTQYFGAGRYEFTAVADDGVRLYIDGKRVIDQWQGPANTEFSHVAELGEGKHTIKMEYVERGGGATAALSWDSALDQPSDAYRAQYWNAPPGVQRDPRARRPSSRATRTRSTTTGARARRAQASRTNRFVARWTRTMSFAPGDYEFAVTADDGVRLYVDGVRVIDKWIDQAPTTYRTTLPLDGGPHTIVMEYYENGGGATARLDYSRVGDPPADDRVPRGVLEHAGRHGRRPASRPARPTSSATTRRSTSTGARARREPASRRTGSWRAGRRPWCSRPASTGSPASATTGCGSTSTTCRSSTSGPPATRSTASTRSSRAAHTSCASSTSRRAAAREPSSPTSGSATSCPPTGATPPSTSPTATWPGAPVLTRTDDAVDFDWGGGAPGDGVPADNFSARWTKSVTLAEAGAYKFTVTGDDGVRLYVDGEKVLDKWIPQGRDHVHRHPPPGPGHARDRARVLRGRRGRGRQVRLREDLRAASATAAARAVRRGVLRQQRPRRRLRSSPAPTTRSTSTGARARPSSGVPVDRFSARWTRTKTYAAGTYRFSVTGDDGIRVLVDGTPVVDGWFYQPPTTYTRRCSAVRRASTPWSSSTSSTRAARWPGSARSRVADPPP